MRRRINAKSKTLVIDDDGDYQDATGIVLEKSGFAVDSALTPDVLVGKIKEILNIT